MKLMKVFSMLCMQFSMPAIQRKQKGESKSPPSNCQICSWKNQDRNAAGKIQQSANYEGLDSPFPRIILGQRRVLEWAFANPWPTWTQRTRGEASVELCWLTVAKGPGLPSPCHPWPSQQGTTHAGVAEMLCMSLVLLEELQQRFSRGTTERLNSAKIEVVNICGKYFFFV